MPLNIREFFKYGGKIENYERKVCLTTEKMAIRVSFSKKHTLLNSSQIEN